MYTSFSDWFKVDKSIIDRNDPNCVWKESKGQYQIWSPVRLIALYVQLFMPFRGSQICWLDSGEADTHLLTKHNKGFQWEENTILKEYRVPEKNWQGFLKPTESLTYTNKNHIIGVKCHVNTNKTAKNTYTGYDVPWLDERIIPWLIMLRDWQIKYNPLSASIKWSNDFKSTKLSETQLKKYGYNSRSCFLFRDPNKGFIYPLGQSKLSSAFCGLLYLIQDEELPLAYLKKEGSSNKALSNFRSPFTLHSMRVSLITAFIRDAKISPEIVQKLVGHSSLVMTIY